MYAEQQRQGFINPSLGSVIGAIAASKPASEVDNQLSGIAQGLSFIEANLAELHTRLNQVMCESPEKNGTATPREMCGSSLGQQLQTQAERAHAVAERIAYLMSCLRI